MPRRRPAGEAMARIVRSAEFEQVLRAQRRASTAHFAVHHLAAPESAATDSSPGPPKDGLSTIEATASGRPVEDSPAPGLERALGAVVPKRHARRSVTRSLLKRLIYAAAARHGEGLASGLWVVRLRAPFDRAVFPSAASAALRSQARAELDTLFRAAAGSVAR